MRKLRELIANRVTEKDIRDHLSAEGFRGNSARFDYVDLFAIQRPGWVQVFVFAVNVAEARTGQRRHFYGVMRDDERRGFKIRLTDSEIEQERIAEEWSVDLITRQRTQLGLAHWFLLVAFAAAMALALLGALRGFLVTTLIAVLCLASRK